MNKFKDKIVLVTGAASGIGRALCEELGRAGATLVMADIHREGLARLASGLAEGGGRAHAAHLDVSNAEEVQALVDRVISEHGRLDYMFNNAGIAIAGELRDLSLDHWRRIIDVNLWGVIYGTSAAYSAMVEQGFGHIVNTASLAGLVGSPTMIPYATTKSAVVGLSTSLRAEAEEFGVKVSVVCPGFIQTGIFDAAIYVHSRQKDILDRIPFRLMDVTRAARLILRGVERNKAIIVFPFYGRLLWWFQRMHNSLTMPLARKTLRDFRASRARSKARGNS
ncbi:MAG TPA: SDR family NAD(P)-dependent oxidoreductase [Blastocatellia bacterium]|nr:SDR family NAD(P)-dependent oxidoreductase [Blastocatellia bacterium]